jgi:hypothetical protein
MALAVGAGGAPVIHNAPPFPDAAANPAFNSVHTFHVGIWFSSPADAQAAGCPATGTPFGGNHAAGIQVLSTRQFANDQGPLRQIDSSVAAPTPDVSLGNVVQSAQFALQRSPEVAGASCLPNAGGRVTVRSNGAIEVMDVSVFGLRANSDYALFILQLPASPYGVAWYQGDLVTDGNGSGSQRYAGRFNVESFLVAPGSGPSPALHTNPPFPDAGSNPSFNPLHTFHVGLWFTSPSDAQAVGCPGTLTPFSGGHTSTGQGTGFAAGIQVLNSGTFASDQGPLRSVGAAAVTGVSVAPAVSVAEPAVDPNNDDEARKLTEQQRREKRNTNRLGKDGYQTEGDVLELHCGAEIPSLLIGNRDGRVLIRIHADTLDFQCGWARPGDYLIIDSGEKQHEQLYDAYELTLERRR